MWWNRSIGQPRNRLQGRSAASMARCIRAVRQAECAIHRLGCRERMNRQMSATFQRWQPSGATRFFGVVILPQTYLNLTYLLLAFPLGTAYFILLVTGFSLGLGLMVTLVGVPVLLATLVAARAC